jgi:16S rRNA processing protein RimM
VAPETSTEASNRAARRPVTLGRISGLYGIRGWVKVTSYTEPRGALLDYKDCLVGQAGSWDRARLAEGRMQGKALLARLEGTHDRDAAARYVGAEIAVAREQLPETAPGEYYWADLEGLRVRHRDGRILGRVAYLLATGGHDVLVVQEDKGADGAAGREVLIPFVPGRYVQRVDLGHEVIDVDWEWD